MHVTKFFYNSFLEHLVSSYTDAHKMLHPSNYSYLNFLCTFPFVIKIQCLGVSCGTKVSIANKLELTE